MKTWKTTKLKNLVQFSSGEFLPSDKQSNGKTPVYGGNGITGWHDESIVEESTIVIGRVGANCGSIHFTNQKSWITDNAIFINKISHEISPEYLFWYLSRLNINRLAEISAQPKISQGILNNVLAQFPENTKEQKKIVSILTNIENQIKLYDQIIQTTKKLKTGLVQILLTKGIRHKKFKKENLGVRSQEIEIPENWNMVILQSVSEHITKGATPTTYGFEWSENEKDILFVRNECIKPERFQFEGSLRITSDAHEFMNRSKIISGDVLISITGEIGRTCLFPSNPKEANINQHIARIRISSKEIIPDYIVSLLNSSKYMSYFYTINQGLTHPHLSLGQVQNTKIPKPGVDEQEKIVSILSKVDLKILDLESKRNAFETLKKGLMQNLLTGQIRVKIE